MSDLDDCPHNDDLDHLLEEAQEVAAEVAALTSGIADCEKEIEDFRRLRAGLVEALEDAGARLAAVRHLLQARGVNLGITAGGTIITTTKP